MIEEPIVLPAGASDEAITTAIDDVIAAAGLEVTLRNTLRQYRGCLHWHVKPSRAVGTLEITFWPAQRRAWFSVQQRRQAPWIADTLAKLQQAIEQRLQVGDRIGEP